MSVAADVSQALTSPLKAPAPEKADEKSRMADVSQSSMGPYALSPPASASASASSNEPRSTRLAVGDAVGSGDGAQVRAHEPSQPAPFVASTIATEGSTHQKSDRSNAAASPKIPLIDVTALTSHAPTSPLKAAAP